MADRAGGLRGSRAQPDLTLLWRLAGEATALYFHARPGYEARITEAGVLMITGVADPDMNLIMLDAGPNAADQLRQFVATLRSRRLPATAFVSAAASASLGPTLHDLGMQPHGHHPLMTLQPELPPAPSGTYTVEAVRDLVAFEESSRVLARAFSDDLEPQSDAPRTPASLLALSVAGATRFLARRASDREPVSAVTSIRTGSIAGIWGMGTPRRYQGQGAGRALLESVIAWEMERGADFFYLISTDAGRKLYERVGFREVSRAEVWIVPSTA